MVGTQQVQGGGVGGGEPEHLRKLVQQEPRRVGTFLKSVLPDGTAAGQWENRF